LKNKEIRKERRKREGEKREKGKARERKGRRKEGKNKEREKERNKQSKKKEDQYIGTGAPHFMERQILVGRYIEIRRILCGSLHNSMGSSWEHNNCHSLSRPVIISSIRFPSSP
jgi:hypothetical protein